mgnify:CR=1 FL=1
MKRDLKIPKVTFRTREGDEVETDGGCAIGGQWVNKTTDDYFKDKKVVVVSLPGAFTPVCSSKQLPAYEKMYDQFIELGCTNVYCMSVNDSFVMNAWADRMQIQNVKMIPDGNAEFTEGVGFSTTFKNRGFGQRSWRYSAVIIDGIIEKEFVEPGLVEDSDPDPFEVSDAETMLAYLKENK